MMESHRAAHRRFNGSRKYNGRVAEVDTLAGGIRDLPGRQRLTEHGPDRGMAGVNIGT